MSTCNSRVVQIILAIVLSVSLSTLLGCVTPVINPVLSSTVGGLTLESLGEIQRDERLTDDQKRDQIRTATGAPNSPEGDRMVNFLLTLNIP